MYDHSSANTQAYCRTDQTSVLKESPWFRFPYPGQWGTIIFSWPATLTMLAGALSAMVRLLSAARSLTLCRAISTGIHLESRQCGIVAVLTMYAAGLHGFVNHVLFIAKAGS